MSTYVIPPEDCLILKALHQNGSLRQAAKSLQCDPSSLVRKAQRISKEHGLLQKVRGKWTTTERGRSMLVWLEESAVSQKRALASARSVKIAAAAWFQEQALIPSLGKFQENSAQPTDFSLFALADDSVASLAAGDIDFLITCDPPEDPMFAHKRLANEKWIAIIPPQWSKKLAGKSKTETYRFLARHPFVRHMQLNPNTVLPNDIPFQGPIALSVDHLIGVRAAVIHGLGWSSVPAIAVKDALSSGHLRPIDLPLTVEKGLCLWWLRDRSELKRTMKTLVSWLDQACAGT